MSTAIVLLRGINVGGNKLIPMADLRALAKRIGCLRAETYIQSGNVIVSSALALPVLESKLEHEIEKTCGFQVTVIARSAKQWSLYAKGSPFPEAEEARPNMLYLALAKLPLKAGASRLLADYAKSGERVSSLNDALWLDYPAGAGRSKITPTVLDRAAGSPVTARNWRTVQKLNEMAKASST